MKREAEVVVRGCINSGSVPFSVAGLSVVHQVLAALSIGQRDATMILVCFRHGLRASELCELQWSDVEFETSTLRPRRAKGGAPGTHPLPGDELRAHGRSSAMHSHRLSS